MDLDKFFETVAAQESTVLFTVKLTPAEREALGKLAKAYKLPMAQVVKRLIRQATVDYYQEGECTALAKHNQ